MQLLIASAKEEEVEEEDEGDDDGGFEATTKSTPVQSKPFEKKKTYNFDWKDKNDALESYLNDDLPSNPDAAAKEKMNRLKTALQEDLLTEEEYRKRLDKLKIEQ